MKGFIQSLYSSPINLFMTFFWCAFLYIILPPFFDWAVLKSVFFATDASQCVAGGACWAFIIDKFDDFIFGRYPNDERWRVIAGLALPLILLISAMFTTARMRPRLALIAILSFPISIFVFFYGGFFNLTIVETNDWGGFSLTLVIAISTLASAMPIGIFLATCRQSDLPIISILATVFIEVTRSVPLIAILFIAAIIFPIFLPDGNDVDKLLRTITAMSLFAGAYMAEIVRGGLQAVPKEQEMTAVALGFNRYQTMRFIILPQALRHAIPSIVNLFIGVFKDTTLVLVIGLFDLMNFVTASANSSKWFGTAAEGYIFVALVFFICCFSMGRYAKRLEQR